DEAHRSAGERPDRRADPDADGLLLRGLAGRERRARRQAGRERNEYEPGLHAVLLRSSIATAWRLRSPLRSGKGRPRGREGGGAAINSGEFWRGGGRGSASVASS